MALLLAIPYASNNLRLLHTLNGNWTFLMQCYLRCNQNDYTSSISSALEGSLPKSLIASSYSSPQAMLADGLEGWSQGLCPQSLAAGIPSGINRCSSFACKLVAVELVQRLGCTELVSAFAGDRQLAANLSREAAVLTTKVRTPAARGKADWLLQLATTILSSANGIDTQTWGDLYLQHGQVRYAMEDYLEAARLFRLASITYSKQPDTARLSALALHWLGQTHTQQGDTAAAVDAFSSALQTDPHLAAPYIGLARLAQQTGDNATAQTWLERGTNTAEETDRLFLELGSLLAREGRRDDALQIWLGGIERDSDSYRHWLLAAVAQEYARKGEVRLADEYYRSALDRAINSESIWSDWLTFVAKNLQCQDIEQMIARIPPGTEVDIDVRNSRESALIACGMHR